jgi:hypothetical protein
MRQVLHIFLKDLRHYWRESVVSAGLLVAFAWNEMRGWLHDNDLAFGLGGFFSFGFLSGLIVALVPVAWSFLAVRTIQGESLVGNRQFWVTRPYEWKKLLTAKLLFVVTFVNLPLLITQVFLLAKAGFSPAQHAVGLLWMQIMMWLCFMLPIVALATVTATVVQVILALLIVVLYAVGMGVLSEYIPSSGFSGTMDSVTAGLLICACFFVILLQYARRETTKARLILVGLAVAMLFILAFTPYKALVDREFPPISSGQLPPLQISLLPPDKAFSEARAPQENDETQIRMPLRVSGIASGSVLIMSGVLIEIESVNGIRWNSSWKSPGLFLFPEQDRSQIDFALKKKLFERLKSSPVKVRVSLALSVFLDQHAREFITPEGSFLLPEVGRCSAEGGYYRRIHCLAPLRGPSFLLMRADMSKDTCPLAKGESPHSPGELAWGWVQNGGSEPAEFGITPVKPVNLYLSSTNTSPRDWGLGICPGTELTLSNPQIMRRTQITVHFEGVPLLDYRQGEAKPSTTNVVLESR